MLTLAFWTPGGWELIVIAGVALILFGRRLPEVGRSLGKGIVEFKKGLSGLEDEIDNAGSTSDKDTASSEHTPPTNTSNH
jgi:sec-independent protein translocase protein TatA